MNKTEFIGVIARKANISKVEAKKVIDTSIQTMGDALMQGAKVSMLGFGSFAVVEKAARRGINPKTKEAITIPARKVIKFKPGAALSKSVD